MSHSSSHYEYNTFSATHSDSIDDESSDHKHIDRDDSGYHTLLYLSNTRAEPIPAGPRYQTTYSRVPTPSCSRRTVNDGEVQWLFHNLDMLNRQGKPLRRPRCSDTAFALAALRVFRFPTDHAFPLFWSLNHRKSTALLVQRVLDSGEPLILPMNWKGVTAILASLSSREQDEERRQLKRKMLSSGVLDLYHHPPTMAPRKWPRETILRNLELIGTLDAPLPPTLPPSPPASRSSSPAPSTKRKALPNPPKPNKRARTDADRPVEDGELTEEAKPVSLVPSTVPVKRPRLGKINTRQCDALHDKYHAAGRLLKYSGDARFWSTYPSSHKEYRALSNPPPPNSPYYKYGGLIARLELLDALVCFTYSIWNREYCRRSCNRETWRTIEGFLVWCKQKWGPEEGTTDPEKAFFGLIWMIEGYIHARKLVYATNHGTTLDRDTDKLMAATRAAVAAAAEEANTSSLVPKSGATPVMLPSPASLAPSANSTPTNRDGTPSSTSTTANTASLTTAMTPSTLPSVFVPTNYKHKPLAPNVVTAMEAVTVPIGPRLLNEFKTEQLGIANAAICMNHSQTYLTLPIMARHFPTTFARMVMSSLSVNEEHEPDFEDEEGELFWPGQSMTGEGLGWVCLMGKAMIKEFGKAYSYRGLEGVVPKPRPEEEAGQQQQQQQQQQQVDHNSPMQR
ncbi:hypothetical protein MIND_00070200 [Mycena indigotica]|uniref:Uncharacterized protein n=1 Tax=Mycena indigotica TaxID=2126181 RepID=A0A8H6WKB3_9AGAR|nr:uncharacterized protein MIND_00070200 [Mycena indigotica]KAF7315549.1 hypothetical protein MIND_00070200 [Mycena indigotica]